MIVCQECGSDIHEIHDTTYSNVETHRAYVGQHTGDIYKCEECGSTWIDDFLANEVYSWRY